MMLIQFILGCTISVAVAFPDAGQADGKFRNSPHARGVPQGHRFTGSEGPLHSAAPIGSAHAANDLGGAYSEPTKTFYVNVPQENYPIPPPIAAGPPRKHYRIVFIRSPSPPPPQQILPPKVEQKTLIYVLHPRHQPNEQNVVEVPSVQHDPQVYFVQYENEPPTPQDLQNLVKSTLEGDAGGNFNFGGPAGPNVLAGAPSPIDVYPPGNNLHFKRGIPEQKFAQPQLPQTFQQQASEKVVSFEEAPSKGTNSRNPSLSESQRYRKRPQVIPARVPSANRRSDVIEPTESKRGSSSNSASIVATPEFQSIFGDTFDIDKPFKFGGKLKPRTATKEEKISSDDSIAKS